MMKEQQKIVAHGDMLFLSAVMLLISSGVSGFGNNMSAVRLGKVRLLEDLKAHSAFKNKVSPCGDDNTVNITFQYRHSEVLSVDEVEQTVTSVGSVTLSWADPDLTWNKADYEGVDFISLPLDEMWHPKIIVHNAVDPDYVMIDRVDSLRIRSDGIVGYVTPVFLKTTCNLNLEYYPFDVQTCNIVFFPYLDDVEFNIHSSTIDSFKKDATITGQWTTLTKAVVTTTLTFEDDLQVVSFTMVIQRRYLYYLTYIIAPMVLTSSMTSMVFWIPPCSGEKISFLVTVFASNAVFLNFIAGAMPSNMASDLLHTPRVTIFLIFVNLQCMFAMILTIFVLRIYKNEQEDIISDEAGVFPEQTEQNVPQDLNNDDQSAREDKVPPGRTSYPTSFHLAPYLFRKMVFFITRIAPSRKIKNKNNPRKRKKCCGRCLRSSTWDILFFCIFHIIGVPTYYLLFTI